MQSILIVLLLLLFFPIKNIHADNEKALVDPNTSAPMLTFGRGYDSVSGDTRGYCIQLQPQKTTASGLASVDAELLYIDNYELLARSLDISSSTNIKMGMIGTSLSANAKFLKNQRYENHSLYFMIKVTVTSPVEILENAQLADSYVNMLKGRGANVAAEFRKRCGDEFVVEMKKGGAFYALVQINSKSKEDKEKLAVTIQGKIGSYASSSNQLQMAVDEIRKDHEAHVFIHQTGGLMEKIPFTLNKIEEMMEYASAFADNINKNGGGVPILSTTERYEQLSNFPYDVAPIYVENYQEIIDQLSSNRYISLDKVHELDYILNNQKFYQLDSDLIKNLNSVRNQYVANLNIITKIAGECFKNIEKCRLPSDIEGFSLPEIPEIKLKTTDARNCIQWLYHEKADSICGPKSFKVDQGAVCGVKSYNEGSSSVCGIKGFNKGRGNACGVETYIEKRNPACGISEFVYIGELDYDDNPNDDSACIKRGYDKARINTVNIEVNERWGLTYVLYCARYLSCRTPANGIEAYKECSHPDFGTIYNTCRHSNFGVELYNTCAHESFGVAEYKTCRHESFGRQECTKYAE
ncbi:MAG: hypothetical protein HQK52_22250 [Oligoflexia bacterium]|nr:hypothetical protein [Oligoflexia bacterium]